MDRATRYDAIIATLVGVSALVVSAYTAHIQRQQVRAQVYPIVQLTSGYSDHEVHVILSNKGSGPAMIRNVQLSADGKPVHDWLELVGRAVGDEHASANLSYSSFGHEVLAAGERITVLSLTCARPAGAKPATSELPRHLTLDTLRPDEGPCLRLLKLWREASISICYCSTLDECSLLSDAPGRDATTTETRRCPAPSADSFN